MQKRPIVAAGLFFLLASGAGAQSLETAVMPGQVIQGHAKFEAVCGNCHIRFNRAAQTGQCLDCHKEIARDQSQRRRFHGHLQDKECRSCHTDHKGRGANIAPINAATFDHAQTDFLLRGGHASPKIQCRSCHVPSKKYREAPSECYACHKKDDKHAGKLGTACADCHSEKNWKETRFDHRKTRFPLRNGHADVPCESCHKSKDFKGAPLACVACHQKDDQKKGHHGKFGLKCETCHTDKSWKTTTFNHDRDTRYPLKGRHQVIRCQSCHTGILYHETFQTACIACHRNDDMKKGHQGRFGGKCETCHSERSWASTTFDHNRDTKYPLRGKHLQAKCSSCHTGFLYRDKLSTSCVACHRNDDMKKGHQGRFGEKCQTCHIEKAWTVSIFDHDKTRYPLRGRHARIKCESCHVGILYKDTLPTACLACHRKDDSHKGQLGPRCESCHNETSWKQTQIDHGLTRFPLLGKHARVACKDCHTTPQFKDAKVDCYSCHRKDDKHKLRLGTLCEDCHNPRSWKQWDFDHNKRTAFVLDGAHRGLDCVACHKFPTRGKASIPATCVSCHGEQDVHNGGFGRLCERCHVSSSFKTIRAGAAGRLFR
jgi:hypothetical protein